MNADDEYGDERRRTPMLMRRSDAAPAALPADGEPNVPRWAQVRQVWERLSPFIKASVVQLPAERQDAVLDLAEARYPEPIYVVRAIDGYVHVAFEDTRVPFMSVPLSVVLPPAAGSLPS